MKKIIFMMLVFSADSLLAGPAALLVNRPRQPVQASALSEALRCNHFISTELETFYKKKQQEDPNFVRPQKKSTYHIHASDQHFIFYTGGTNIGGRENVKGFIQATPKGARFCNANFVRGSANSFTVGGQQITYPANASSKPNSIGEISESQCLTDTASREDAERIVKTRVANFVQDYVTAQIAPRNRAAIRTQLLKNCGDQSEIIKQTVANLENPSAPASAETGLGRNAEGSPTERP